MISIYRGFEIAVCAFLYFLPTITLTLCPYIKQFRFSKTITFCFIILIIILQIFLGALTTFPFINKSILSLISTFIYAFLYFLVVKEQFTKILFTLFATSNIARLILTLSKYMESIFFPRMAVEPFHYSFTFCMIICHFIITLPLFFYLRNWFANVMRISTSFWRYLWIIPAIFYLIWHNHLYFMNESGTQIALNINQVLFLLCINLGALFIYHTIAQLLVIADKQRILAHENHLLSIYKLQYENLQQHINEARQAKHDVHHHSHLIREYLRKGKLQELEAYLNSYSEALPDTQIVYCQHYAANALLSYFAQYAKDNDIHMDIFVQLPQTLQVPETTLSVVLGNLLENAIDACSAISDGVKQITVRGKADDESIFFEVRNTYSGTLRKSLSGKYLSTKSSSRGLGLDSISHLVKAHNGAFELDTSENGIFRASILLPNTSLPQETQ